jgi:transposase-like protein
MGKLFSKSVEERMISLYEDGCTDAQVAKELGVSTRTIYYWKSRYVADLQAINRAKANVDEMVEAALLRVALGYSHPEEKIFCAFGQVTKVQTMKHYPPDVKAAIYWLNNRNPDRWKNRLTVEPGSKFDEVSREKQVQPKKTFKEFCVEAGYPEPFEKQIEMMNFGINGTDPRMILGARGYGKTDYITILGVAYALYLDRSLTTLIMSKSKERNASMLKEIQIACEKNGLTFSKANTNCLRVDGLLGKDHSVSAVTIRSVSLRGRHPKLVIMDDPVTEDDTSEATRLVVEKKWYEINKLVKNILIIGQPAHKFDLYAKLRPLLNKMEVKHGEITELDHDLEAQRLAGVSEESIQASYFLEIKNQGNTPFDKIKYIDSFPSGESAVAFIDPSYTGGDYTALTIMKAHFDGVAVVGFVWKKAWNHCLNDMEPHLIKYNVKRIAFETNNLGDQPVIMLQNLLRNAGVGVVGKISTLEKHSKIMSAGSFAHLIHLSKESDKIYTDQVAQYEYRSKHDDAPDSLASCLEWLGLIRGK